MRDSNTLEVKKSSQKAEEAESFNEMLGHASGVF